MATAEVGADREGGGELSGRGSRAWVRRLEVGLVGEEWWSFGEW